MRYKLLSIDRYSVDSSAPMPNSQLLGRPTGSLAAVLVRRAGRHEGELLAGRVDHQQAGPLQAAAGQIDVSLDVDAHAVAAILGAEIDQRLAWARSPGRRRPSGKA